MFVQLLLEGAPGHELWQEFSYHLILDYLPSSGQSLAVTKSLMDIGRLLSKNGRRCSDFGLDEPHEVSHEVMAE